MSDEELAVPCQEPERSGLVDGEAWWPVLDRAERAEARVAKLEAALRQIADLDPDLTEDGYDRDDLCRYADDVEALALNGLADPYGCKRP